MAFQRLDALLERIDNIPQSDFGTQDYLNLVDEPQSNAEDERIPSDLGDLGDLSDVDDATQAENTQQNEPSTEQQDTLAHLFSDNESIDAQKDDGQDYPAPESPKPSPSPSLDGVKNHQEVPSHPVRTRNSKTRASELMNQSEDQRLRRQVGDVGSHTVKSATIKSFLEDFSNSSESEPELETQSSEAPANDAHVNILSSPPRMQGLKSFMNTSIPGDSDSDLEIIPETRKNRMNKPVKEMLRLQGTTKTSADRQLAQMRQRLAKLEAAQINARRNQRREELQQSGVDLEFLEQQMKDSRAKMGGAEAWIEQERANAAKFAEEEADDEGEEGNAHNDAVENDAAEADLDDIARWKLMRRKMLSDSEDEDEDEDEDDVKEVGNKNQKESRSDTPAEAQSSFGENQTVRTAADSAQVAPELAGRTGTQYVEPVSQSMMAQILGDTGTQYAPPVSQSKMADILGISEDEETPEDSREPTPTGEDLDENLEETPEDGSVGEETPQDTVANEEDDTAFDVPDVSDIQGTLSQRLVEVRKRYLANKSKQRQNTEMQKRAQQLLEVEADESDEEGGILANNNDEEGEEGVDNDADLEEILDRGKVKQNEAEIKRRFAEQEKLKDDKLLHKLVQGVNGQGFHRNVIQGVQNGNMAFLDSETMNDNGEDTVSIALREAAQRRRQHMLQTNSKAAKLAGNNKATAFFSSISEDLVARPGARPVCSLEESLQFLRNVDCNPQEPVDPLHDLRQESRQNAAAAGPMSTVNDRVRVTVRKTSSNHLTRQKQNSDNKTYAAKIASADFGNKNAEILQSLGAPKMTKKPKNKFVAPLQQQSHSKKRRINNTTPARAVFGNRNWE